MLHVLDRDELELPFNDLVLFRDIEGSEELFAEPWAFRKAYHAAMQQFLDERPRRVRRPRHRPRAAAHRPAPGRRAVSHYLHARDEAFASHRTLQHESRHGPMSTLTFLNSPLLWGLAAGRRSRSSSTCCFGGSIRRVDWAPMHYLKLSIQRNRRRIRIEQLLLLLVPHGADPAAVLSGGPAGACTRRAGNGWAGRSRTSQILLIDDSLTMGLDTRGRTAFARAQELSGEWLPTWRPRTASRCSSRPISSRRS